MKVKDSNGNWQTVKFKNYGIEQTPIGSMMYMPSQNIPNGYLLCDGSTYLIADYPLLFNAIGYIGGEDVETGYFKVPDMRDVVPAGYNPNLASTDPMYGTFGATVGNKTHTLTKDELPEHSHAVDVTTSTGGDGSGSYGIQQRYSNSYSGNTIDERTASNNWNGVLLSGGGNQAHPIIQPTKLYNWMIKAKNVITLGGYTEDFEITGDLTMINGKLVMPTNKYFTTGGAIVMNNSDIVNIGGLYMNDKATGNEGLNFLKSGGDNTNADDYECLRGLDGELYFGEVRYIPEDELYYKSGETATLGNTTSGGYITSSTTSIRFDVYTPKDMSKISSISITGGEAIVRGISGYVGNSNNVALSLTDGTYTCTASRINSHCVRISINHSSAYSNGTNNTPLGCVVSNLKVKFA